MEFSRQDYWSGLLFLPPGDLPDPGINTSLLHWQVDFFFTTVPPGTPLYRKKLKKKKKRYPKNVGEKKKALFVKLSYTYHHKFEVILKSEPVPGSPGGGVLPPTPRVSDSGLRWGLRRRNSNELPEDALGGEVDSGLEITP